MALLLLSGCASLDGRPAERVKPQNFAAYAEDVFRRQNNATSRIMTLSAEELNDEAQYEKLLTAEKDMNNACELLNDYARRSQDGEPLSVLLRSRVGVAIKDCDRTTQTVENLLNNIDRFMTAATRLNAK